MSIFKDQWQVMQLADQTATKSVALSDIDKHSAQVDLYANLVAEEYYEFDAELGNDIDDYRAEKHCLVKEAVDILVVTAGYLITMLGADGAQKAWDLVNATNLAKVKNGAIKREDGKFLQTPEYKQKLKAKLMADLQALLES